MAIVLETNLPGLTLRRGKVRDVYALPEPDAEKLLIVATDRISAFDVILPTAIPDKGRVLTGLSNFWFRTLEGAVPNHLLETDVSRFPNGLRPFAAMLSGRSVLVRKTKVIPIECVVRGYLAGGGWKDYQKTGSICGVALPPGLRQCQRLPSPIFTPTTKAAAGHDESITFGEAATAVGAETLAFVRDQSLRLYETAAAHAFSRGIILADTKFEWGFLPGAASPILIDEILTPDSSRFWPADAYAPGRDQDSFDKQFVRNYLETLDWNKTTPGPALPEKVLQATRARYVEAFERLTGTKFL